MRRIVVDPGVLVSAALSPMGNPARIVEAVRSGRVVLIASPALLAELDDVLGRPKIAAKARSCRAVLPPSRTGRRAGRR
ncbi:MAG: PIN domain-containing protein [Acidimicrobiales bacterium]